MGKYLDEVVRVVDELTNAHIGESGDYPNYQICCKGTATAAETCELKNASWEYEEVYEGVKIDKTEIFK